MLGGPLRRRELLLHCCRVFRRSKSGNKRQHLINPATAGGGGGGINRYLEHSRYTNVGDAKKDRKATRRDRLAWIRSRPEQPRTTFRSLPPRHGTRPESETWLNPVELKSDILHERFKYEQERSWQQAELPPQIGRRIERGRPVQPFQLEGDAPRVTVLQNQVRQNRQRRKLWSRDGPEEDAEELQGDSWPAGYKKPACLRPRHIKRWMRDYFVKVQRLEERKRLGEAQWMKNYREIEERMQRRKLGLPELPIEVKPMFKKPPSRRGSRKVKEPHAHRSGSVWTSRPRNIQDLDRDREEEAQGSWYWHSYELNGPVEEQKNGTETQRVEARAERRVLRFQQYVEQLPEFRDLSSDSAFEEHASRVTEEKKVQQPKFEIPPMIPGRGALLVAGLCDVLKEGKWDADKVASLEKFKYAKLLPYQVCQVLKQLKDWQVALEFFNWAKSIPDLKHDKFNYSAMIMNLGKCGHYVEARKLYDEMVENKVPVDQFTLNNMIKCYGRANRIDEAVAFYQKALASRQCKPDSCTYSLLVDLYGKAGRITEMKELFMDMKAANIEPDGYMFNSLIYNFGKWENMTMVKQAVDQMALSGIKYTTVTYATLIHLYSKVLDLKSAERTYTAYLQSNSAPDLYVFNSMIQALGVSCRCREAEWVMEDIERAGLAPDTFSYCTIISTWGRQGCTAEAKKWFDKAQARGVTPTPEMCNAMMDAYLRVGNLEGADKLLSLMHSLRVRPSLETYTYLLNIYTDTDEEFVKPLRDLMQKTEHPAHQFLEQIFKGEAGISAGQLKDFAQAFFDSMRLEKQISTRKFANAVIHYLQLFGYESEASIVFEAAMANKLFRELVEEKDQAWRIWLVNMDPGTALVGLSQALALCKHKVKKQKAIPKFVAVHAGTGKHVHCRTALEVKAMLEELRTPFVPHDMYPQFECGGLNFFEWVKDPFKGSFIDQALRGINFDPIARTSVEVLEGE